MIVIHNKPPPLLSSFLVPSPLSHRSLPLPPPPQPDSFDVIKSNERDRQTTTKSKCNVAKNDWKSSFTEREENEWAISFANLSHITQPTGGRTTSCDASVLPSNVIRLHLRGCWCMSLTCPVFSHTSMRWLPWTTNEYTRPGATTTQPYCLRDM